MRSARFFSSTYNWARFINGGARTDESWLQVVPGKSIWVRVLGEYMNILGIPSRQTNFTIWITAQHCRIAKRLVLCHHVRMDFMFSFYFLTLVRSASGISRWHFATGIYHGLGELLRLNWNAT